MDTVPLSGGNNSGVVSIPFFFNLGGAVLTPGLDAWHFIPFDCTIQSATVLGDQTGSIQFTLGVCDLTGYNTFASIVGSSPPLLSSAKKSSDSILSGWTTFVKSGSILKANISTVATLTACGLYLAAERA